MHKAIASLAAASLALLVGQSIAGSPMDVRGYGTNSCGSLTQAYAEVPSTIAWSDAGTVKRPESTAYMSWILGYMAASQRAHSYTLAVDYAGIEEWIKGYCASNPDRSVVQAAMAFEDHVRAP